MATPGASRQGRSLWRILFWEALGAAGWFAVAHHPFMGHPSEQRLFYLNALFFLAAYPFLFIYRWAAVEGFLSVLLGPFSWLLSWVLGVSAYFWLEYGCFVFQPTYYSILAGHWVLCGILLIFPYFLIVQKFWGVSRLYYTMEECLALGLWAALGGAAGFLMGKWTVNHLENVPWLGGHRFLAWLLWIWLGVVAASWIAQKKKK